MHVTKYKEVKRVVHQKYIGCRYRKLFELNATLCPISIPIHDTYEMKFRMYIKLIIILIYFQNYQRIFSILSRK